VTNPRIVIKKYENRRLYDTSRSKYVNLDEIARLVRKGRDVQVLDAKTGEDLTRATLMQVIVEDSREGPAGLPLELLRQLIVASDHVGKEFLMWYLKSAFDAYDKVQQSFTNGLSNVQSAAGSPIDTIRNFFSASAGKSEQTEVEALRTRLAELEARLHNENSRKPAKKKMAPKKGSRSKR
jgi:polyhydroxyalkanoate synthesis repressor PhaR